MGESILTTSGMTQNTQKVSKIHKVYKNSVTEGMCWITYSELFPLRNTQKQALAISKFKQMQTYEIKILIHA